MEDDKGFFINKNTCICYSLEDKELQKNAEFLSEYIQFTTGMKLEVSNKIRNKNVIILRNDYNQRIQKSIPLKLLQILSLLMEVVMRGLFMEIQTLRKAVPANASN